MTNALNFSELKASGRLPSPKGVALNIMKLCQRENVSLPELAHTIQADPVLAGRIIKIANIANPNKSRRIASVTIDTLIVIGIHAVRQVVLGFSLISANSQGECKVFDYKNYWSHSVAKASAAQAIGALLRIAPPAELFTCGLLADIGQLGLAAVRPDDYAKLITQNSNWETDSLSLAEKEMFGIDQRELSRDMMTDWGIPKLFVDAVYFHQHPEDSGFAEGSRQRKLTYTLQLASVLADAFLSAEGERKQLKDNLFLLGSTLGLEKSQLADISNQAMADWKEWGTLLEIETNASPLFVAEDLIDAQEKPTEEPHFDVAAQDIAPMRIVYADDDESLLFMVKTLLTTSGHSVSTASNGIDALSLAESFKPQVVIIDWLMPGMNGPELCRAIRKAPWGSNLYLVILTTLEDERYQIEALEAGADAYLKKPFNPRLLNAKLLAAQRRQQG